MTPTPQKSPRIKILSPRQRAYEIHRSKIKRPLAPVCKGKCVLSNKDVQKSGYSRIYVDGKNWSSHRFSYFKKHGNIPSGKMILHKCDVRNCINPNHLYAGTYKDNARDCIQRGRHTSQVHPEKVVRGSSHVSAKLKESDIPTIFRLSIKGMTRDRIGKIYGVGKTSIEDILKGKNWKHVKI
jgi:hypothetical protein